LNEDGLLTWHDHRSWVAVFDILGFKERSRRVEADMARQVLQMELDELLACLTGRAESITGVRFQMVSDTIVLFAPDTAPVSYPHFVLACKMFLADSIRIRMPVTGASSCGLTASAIEQSIIIGPAVVEAYEHCEAQDWVGLVTCVSATRAIRAAGADPLRNGFVDVLIPWRGQRPPPSFVKGEVLAYRFQNGAASFSSPLLPWLEELRHLAPDAAKRKFTNTIAFIEGHYRYLDGGASVAI
jgi:hypothetical protein